MKLILFNKPYRVLSQFTDPQGRETLADYIRVPGVYAAGRLDYDSEGLLLLTDDGNLKARIAHPRFRLPKHYWVQVEGDVEERALQRLRDGVRLKDGPARAEAVRAIDAPPGLWPRVPPIRQRKRVPDGWIDLVIREGRNRQVRRMTAAAGLPTLRLIRHRVGPWRLRGLQPGEYHVLAAGDARRTLAAWHENANAGR